MCQLRKVNNFWKKEEERTCERCGRIPETLESLRSVCGERKDWNRQILSDAYGNGLREMNNTHNSKYRK